MPPAAFTAPSFRGGFFYFMKNDQTTGDDKIFNLENGEQLVATLNRRIAESKSHWDKDYKLDAVSKENEQLYLGEFKWTDEDDKSEDNRIFSSIRTIVPYVTTRITEPEVYPGSKSQAAKKFAEDFERALHIKAGMEKVKDKTKFALEDAIIRRRGYLKPRYDAVLGNFCSVEYVPAESIIIDHKAKPYEEPRYFRHVQEKSIEDLLVMFPDMKEKIYTACGVDKNTPKEKMEEEIELHEDWMFVPDEEEGLDLIVCWSYKELALGAMRDPNWRYGEMNFLPHHMMPLIFFNVLSDGRSYVDKTSFVEQAKPLQKRVDERTRQISANAGLGSIGMPVVDSRVLADDQSQYLTYEPDTVLELDLESAEASSLSEVFDVWKANPLDHAVYEDKIDSRNAIDDKFGTPNVFRGEQSKNNTLGQDVLVRDQAFGRQQEIVDAIDSGMSRLYLFIAQFLLVYGEGEEEFEFMGDEGEYDYVLLNTEELNPKAKIRVKAGTSMPIDNAQRRAVADKAADQGMIDPLTYWEIMDEGNAEKYAKRFMEYTNDPAAFMKETEDQVFNRDAFVDIQKIKQGEQPEFRDDLPKSYFDHLNKYVLSGDLDSPTIAPEVKVAIQQFIDTQLARGQRMLGLMETQLPTPEEVTAANEQTDSLNSADQSAASEQAKQDALAAKNAQPQVPAAPTPVL